MRWIVSLSIVLGCAVTACGGPQIPTHNGYKPKEAKPWKKPKALKFDDKGEAKAEGDLSYPDMRRARWYELNLPSSGQLTLGLEVTPPGTATATTTASSHDFIPAMCHRPQRPATPC